MNTTFQIQIKTHNYEGSSPTITKEILLHDLTKFSNLASVINKNSGKHVWNWFGNGKCMPDKWDQNINQFVLDTWLLSKRLDENFGYKVEDVNLVKEFCLRFIPNGCDGIEWVKFFKVEEITD